jgi:hypothetical protein
MESLQWNSENRLIPTLSQIIHNDNGKIIDSFNPFVDSVVNNFLEVFEEKSDLAASLYEKLNILPSCEQLNDSLSVTSDILTSKFVSLDEKSTAILIPLKMICWINSKH